MNRCVIFDMDGVIIDSEPIHQKCEKEMFNQLGIDVSAEEHNTLVGTTDEAIWMRLGSIYNLPISVSEAIHLKKKLYLEYLHKNRIEPIPFVQQLIADLHKHGFLLALASSSPHMQIDYILNRFEIKQYFSSIVSGEDVQNGKPHPDIFLKVSKLLDMNPSSCVVIEDSNNGVVAAKRAGMKCIGFLNPNSGSQDLSIADYQVKSFNGLSPEKIDSLF